MIGLICAERLKGEWETTKMKRFIQTHPIPLLLPVTTVMGLVEAAMAVTLRIGPWRGWYALAARGESSSRGSSSRADGRRACCKPRRGIYRIVVTGVVVS